MTSGSCYRSASHTLVLLEDHHENADRLDGEHDEAQEEGCAHVVDVCSVFAHPADHQRDHDDPDEHPCSGAGVLDGQHECGDVVDHGKDANALPAPVQECRGLVVWYLHQGEEAEEPGAQIDGRHDKSDRSEHSEFLPYRNESRGIPLGVSLICNATDEMKPGNTVIAYLNLICNNLLVKVPPYSFYTEIIQL